MIEASPRKVSLAPGTLEALRAYAWPGNVRELENRMMRAIALSKDGLIHAADILPEPPKSGGLRDERKEFEKRKVADALRETKGNRTEAAERLGISRRMLQKKLKEFGID